MSQFILPLVALASVTFAAAPAGAQSLQLSLAVQEQSIVAPNPVRAMLKFHNGSQHTIWLYRPVGDISQVSQGNAFEAESAEPGPEQTSGGPRLTIHLAPVNLPAANHGEPAAHGSVILTPDFPHPKLIEVQPGGNYEEPVVIQVEPTRTKAGAEHFAWGRYTFSVTYSAHYSNQEELARNLGINLWHNQLRSNEVTLDLQPPTAQGSIEGLVMDSFRRPSGGILVTLSNQEEEALNQAYTDMQGQFSFKHLAAGRYWITIRDPGSNQNTTVFRHVDLDVASPQASLRMMMIPPETHKPERLLHKPVLFRIVDGTRSPLAGVKLAIVWSTGTVMQDFKAETDQQGYATIDLLPGDNFVTLRRRGCRPEDRRAEVAAGGGLDGFSFVYDCSEK